MIEAQPELNTDSRGVDDGIDRSAQEEVRVILGPKFPAFVKTYVLDTETRLADIGQLLERDEPGKPVARHAHSISSSSAYVGALRLAVIASHLEAEALAQGSSRATLARLFAEMLQSFALAKHALLSDQVSKRA